MPLTRRQRALNTRSSGAAFVPTTPGRSTGVKRRQTEAESMTSRIHDHEPSAPRSDPDNMEKIRLIAWNLVEKYFPLLKISLEQYKSSNKTAVFNVIFVVLPLFTVWTYHIEILNAVTDLWQTERVTADLPSVHFNDVSYHFTKCPDKDKDRHQDWLNDVDGKNSIFIDGSASGWNKANSASHLGVCLFESLNQSKQDNRPVDVIIINASSDHSNVKKNIYNAIKALCTSENTDFINQLNEELIRDFFLSESNSYDTETQLTFLYRKLNELLKLRNSHAVVILYSWRDSDSAELSRFREPSTANMGINS